MRTCSQLVGLVLAGAVLLVSQGHEAPDMSTARLAQDHSDLASGRFPCFRWSVEDGKRPAAMPADPARQGQLDRAIVVSPDQIRRN